MEQSSAHSSESRFIQHHYDDAKHQFDAGKLGMWFFLVQEILFFSGLFVAYIVYRSFHPEIYAYAHSYLDVTMGAINTAVLLVSSLTAAWAVRAAQLNQQRLLVGLLLATIACAFGFLVIKYFEYSHKFHEGLVYGAKFDPCITASGKPLVNKANKCPGHKSTVIYDFAAAKAATGCIEGDLDKDKVAPGIQASCGVTERIVTFRKNGGATEKVEESSRKIASCEETKDVAPCWQVSANPAVCPRGADGLPQHAILVEYGDHLARGAKVQIEAACSKASADPAPADPYGAAAPVASGAIKTEAHAAGAVAHGGHNAFKDGPPPAKTNMFFSIYFAMTGLHGIHVIAGIVVFLWLLLRAMLGHFGPTYFGPIDYAALYWHLVDLIWIFLFPLMYLIH